MYVCCTYLPVLCHTLQVTAVLSVPLLDVSLLCSLLPPLRRRALGADLVFLESYKPVRRREIEIEGRDLDRGGLKRRREGSAQVRGHQVKSDALFRT